MLDFSQHLPSLAIASTVGAALTSVPFAWMIKEQHTQWGKPAERYVDVDGSATPASEAAFTNVVPRFLLLVMTLAGFFVALADSVAAMLTPEPPLLLHWAQLAVWIMLVAQACTVFVRRQALWQYDLGKWSALAALSMSVANVLQLVHELICVPVHDHIIAYVLQLLCALVAALAAISLQRRPDIYHQGRLVDRCSTVSFREKWTFAWPRTALRFASESHVVELDEIATIDHTLRAEPLSTRFESSSAGSQLWYRILQLHKRNYVALFAVQLLQSAFYFVPQVLLYVMLRLLEHREDGMGNQAFLYLVAIGLPLAIAFNDWLDELLTFVFRIRLELPILVQLSAALFRKSTRIQNVVNTPESDASSQVDDTGSEEVSSDEETPSKTKQSIINLMSIDADKIADFSSAVHIFLESFFLVVVAIAFLVKLIGWLPLASGFVIPLLLSPVNLYITRRYIHAETHVMSTRDRKMAMIDEVLQGIRQIKLSALEGTWYKNIFQLRNRELFWQWQLFVLDLWLLSIWEFGPVLLAATSLTVFASMNGSLSASIAFTAISVFSSLESGLEVAPVLISLLMDFRISARRMQRYLDSPEQERNENEDDQIVFENATLAWPSDEKNDADFRLRAVSLDFAMGQLNLITGKTGSGKSLLLSAIIGEAEVLFGRVRTPAFSNESTVTSLEGVDWVIPRSMAYVSQNPWIENATLRENVLFHLPYDSIRYKQVLHACALEQDLKLLPDGDHTEIGANGVTLSGGQKWRVSLARALYSRAGIIIMDDVFSAVDTDVSRHLYEYALTGAVSEGRTRILVTHHVELCLPATQYFVLLGDERVIQAGSADALSQDGSFAVRFARSGLLRNGADPLVQYKENSSSRLRRSSTRSDKFIRIAQQDDRASESAHIPAKLVSSESRHIGSVRIAVYRDYVKACCGFLYWSLVIATFIAFAIVGLGRSYWVTLWTRQYDNEYTKVSGSYARPLAHLNTEQYSYAAIYIGLSLLEGTVGLIRHLALYYGSIRGSKTLFEAMTRTILQTPLRFFDTTPIGRLNNRFSSDFSKIDAHLAEGMGYLFSNIIAVVTVAAAAMFVSPYMIGFLVVLGLVVRPLASLYIVGAREMHRLENVTRSPIFEQYGNFLAGLSTIRAFGMVEVYVKRMHRLIEDNIATSMHISLFNRWVDFRLHIIGAAFTLVTAIIIVAGKDIDASLAGFALSFSLELSQSIIVLIKGYTDVEMAFNAVERVLEYTKLDTEPQQGSEPPAAWPANGEAVFDDLSVSYAEGLPLVLRGLSFSIRQHERVGVVGRTGAGKSSLSLALLRFLEPLSGSICIDGIDISSIKLEFLRSRLTLIPQNPVLFSGTIRSNLDPEQQRTDMELLDALRRARLVPTGEATNFASAESIGDQDLPSQSPLSLCTPVADGGKNFSQGQRQLLCLARAIVAQPKFLILDEATSAVDMETDALVQTTLRTEFRNSTLLVIAHRLSTIADFDRILVLGEGRIIEYGSPRDLMERQTPNGFYDLVMKSGERSHIEEMINSRSVPF